MKISKLRVVALLYEHYLNPNADRSNDEDQKFASKLITLLDRCGTSENFAKSFMELMTELDSSDYFYFADYSEYDDPYDVNLDETKDNDPTYDDVKLMDNTTPDLQIVSELQNGVDFHGIVFPFDQVERALEYYRSGPKQPGKQQGSRTLQTMSNKFRAMFKSNHDLDTLREYERNGHSELVKRRIALAYIDNKTFKKYNEKFGKVEIHDLDICKWAMDAYKEIETNFDFKASNSWIQRWKKRHNLVSRRVTKFVKKQTVYEKQEEEDKLEEFYKEANQKVPKYELKNIFNFDQSGFQFELHTQRTIAPQGSKNVEVETRASSDMTHSLTIMPIVSADGILHKQLFIQIAQAGGKFPDTKEIFDHDNLVLFASTTHMMGKESTKVFYSECLLPTMTANSLLIRDSWATFDSAEPIEELNKSMYKHEFLKVPPHQTWRCQPLDCYGFGPWKKFIKQFDHYIFMHGIQIKMVKRDRELKKHWIVHNQLRAPRFVNMWKEGFYKAKIISQHPEPFETPTQYCFPRSMHKFCCEEECNDISFIRCAHCGNIYCFNHFFTESHYHDI